VVAGIIVVLAFVFARQVRVLQAQAELAAVRSTLGALRTALVINHLHQKVGGFSASVVNMQRNPFEVLAHRPVNYLGAMSASQVLGVPAGSWVFEPVCDCVGYVPLYSQWFVSPSGDVMAWYRLSGEAGPLQLTAKEAYAWQGEVMN
jgi:hypothetical protein